MVTVDELRSALERVARQEGRAGDLQLLRQALARGEITAATGERAVAIGGDARDLAIITGNGNVVNLFKGVDARILRGVLGEGFSPSSNAFDLNERGVTSYRQGQYPEALNYYQQALVIYREVENRAGEGITLNNIGDMYRARGQYDQALNYCQQALVIARDVRNGALEEVVLADMRKVQSSSTPPLVSFIKAIGRSRNRR